MSAAISTLSGAVLALVAGIAAPDHGFAQDASGAVRRHNPFAAQRADRFVFYGRQDRLRAAQRFVAQLPQRQAAGARRDRAGPAGGDAPPVAVAPPMAVLGLPDAPAFPVPTARMMRNADYRRAAIRTAEAAARWSEAEAALTAARLALAVAELRLDQVMRSYSGRDLAAIEAEVSALPATTDDPLRGVLAAEAAAARLFVARRIEAQALALRHADAVIAAGRVADRSRADLQAARAAEDSALVTAWNGAPPEGPELDAFRRRMGL
ncbi:MAG: hypothetical protein CVT84_01415 [Alphaproteobacteria bacterium HGW-Alphaproteobacteria-6]|nr:MAG: hypothetical protein CVT84_01415 [Alphaproteobacteria bacterium HGW-Alphaproteobacteria-6]